MKLVNIYTFKWNEAYPDSESIVSFIVEEEKPSSKTIFSLIKENFSSRSEEVTKIEEWNESYFAVQGKSRRYDYEENIYEVEVKPALKIGDRLFKLEETYLD